jgi:uncharacterized oligopeptide transporter (OPT) family protein
MAPPYLQVVALAFLGGLLGLSAMIPLRRLLIVQAHDELPYPEGTACAQVLKATAESASGSEWIFRGMAVGAAVKLLVSLFFVLPTEMRAALPVLPKAEVALELAPALFGVGFTSAIGSRRLRGGAIVLARPHPLIAFFGASLTAPSIPRRAPVADMGPGTSGRDTCDIGAGRWPPRGS